MTLRAWHWHAGGLKFLAVVSLLVLQAAAARAQSSGLPGAPTGLVASALPCAFELSFTPPDDGGSPILGYYAYDQNAPWICSWSGSSRVQMQSPILIQGGSGAHSFVVEAVNQNGLGPASVVSNKVTSPGTLPPATDPYWIYHAGSFNWSGDFSFPGGAVPPNVPASNAVQLDWFDNSVPALSGPCSVGLVLPRGGNFAPCITNKTIDLVALGYKYWTIAIRPDTDNPSFTIKFETSGDALVTNILPLNNYGTFTRDQWTTVNIPISHFALRGTTIYKMLLETPVAASWHVDNLGFANTPQTSAVPEPGTLALLVMGSLFFLRRGRMTE